MKFTIHTWYCDWIITLSLEIIWQRIIWVDVQRMIMISCPYFIFIDTSISKHVDIFSISAFAWEQARSKLGGVDTSILHHSFILIFIALWAVITHYITIRMPVLSYFIRFTWRGRMPAAGILDWKRSKYYRPILQNSKVLRLHEDQFWNK